MCLILVLRFEPPEPIPIVLLIVLPIVQLPYLSHTDMMHEYIKIAIRCDAILRKQPLNLEGKRCVAWCNINLLVILTPPWPHREVLDSTIAKAHSQSSEVVAELCDCRCCAYILCFLRIGHLAECA